MATTKKRTNWAKCKVWGSNMVAEMDGSILGCMESMLLMVPKEYRQRYVDRLQALVIKANEKEEKAADHLIREPVGRQEG